MHTHTVIEMNNTFDRLISRFNTDGKRINELEYKLPKLKYERKIRLKRRGRREEEAII